MNPDLAPPGWSPLFCDYLYLGYTNAVAFSPTDAMPLAHWAKAAMAIQSMISILILSLVIAQRREHPPVTRSDSAVNFIPVG